MIERKDIVWGICIFLAIVMILLLYIQYFPPRVTLKNAMEKYRQFSEIQGEFETGNLIFFSGENFSSKFIRCATNSPWSHIGIIVMRGNIPFLWECDRGNGMKEGARLIPLKNKFIYYKIGAFAKLTSPINIENLDQFIRSHMNVDLQTSVHPYIMSLFSGCQRPENAWYCSELVAKTYQALGVIPENVCCTSITPKDFFTGDVEGINLICTPKIFTVR